MAKTVRGHTYWQIVESRRVNGKPRPIVLAHLGKADDLLRRLQQPDRPYTALIRDFGAVAALWEIAQDLGLHALLHQHAPKRRQGHAVADYLLLAALGRALRPCPKTRLAQWYQGTILPRLLPIPAKHLSSQRFWDHFDYLDASTLQRIEEALTLRLAQHYAATSRPSSPTPPTSTPTAIRGPRTASPDAATPRATAPPCGSSAWP